MIRKIPMWGTGPYGSFDRGAPAFVLRVAGFTSKKKAVVRQFLPFIVNPAGMTQEEWADLVRDVAGCDSATSVRRGF